MEKVIKVDGKEIRFKATANTIRMYRQIIGEDLLPQMQKFEKQAAAGQFDDDALRMFENLAYIMAKQADPLITDNRDEWFDQFGMFSLYNIMPELATLWAAGQKTSSVPKKKAKPQTGR